MDLFSHFVLPYLAVWALRRPARERIAAGIGGVAPDMDAFTAPLGLLHDSIWFVGHRGLSHSLIGAPLYALVVAGVLTLPWWGRRWPRLAALRFTPAMLAVALLSSYSHLALDGITMWGVPLVFPFSLERWSVDWYFYSVAWAIPVSGAFLWLLWRRAPDARLKQAGVLLVAVLVLSGVVRAAYRPDVDDAVRVIPNGMEWQWASVHERAGGYEVRTWSWGAEEKGELFPVTRLDGQGARDAVQRARDSDLGKGFLLYAGWPVAVEVEATEGGAWNVTFTDVMRRAQMVDARWPWRAIEDYGRLGLVVDEASVRERE